ncbi:hypothetical protein FS749_004994 [Ceratobasidium sp. UAMH 11750]|nr:hypothetical protein FS749_004994 [Ceratobasidium sp. UAMH 11750]
MVKPEVLKENEDWLTKSLVYPSGPEWDDVEPSDPRSSNRAAKKIRTAAGPVLALMQQADAGVLAAQAKIEEFEAMVL